MDEKELAEIERETERRYKEDRVCCGSMVDIKHLVAEVRRLNAEVEGFKNHPVRS